MKKIHAGIATISLELLKEALHLPEEARIINVLPPDLSIFETKTARVIIEHPDLPEVLEGCGIPPISFSVTKMRDGQVVFDKWENW